MYTNNRVVILLVSFLHTPSHTGYSRCEAPPTVGGAVPWAGIPDCIKGRNWVVHNHSSFCLLHGDTVWPAASSSWRLDSICLMVCTWTVAFLGIFYHSHREATKTDIQLVLEIVNHTAPGDNSDGEGHQSFLERGLDRCTQMHGKENLPWKVPRERLISGWIIRLIW